MCVLPGAAWADEYLVTVTGDELDAPADCPADGRGADCSLREAIAAANARAGADDVVVPKGTYTLSLGAIGVSGDPLALQGAGATQTIVDGGGTARILSSSVSTSLADITLQHGHDANGAGAIYSFGGGLTMERSVLRENDVAPTGSGGAAVVITAGPLTFVDSEIAGNTATAGGGNVFGGAVQALSGTSEVTMRGTTVRDNQASGHFMFGGAVYIDDAPTTISRSTFARNTGVGSVQGGALSVGGVSRISATTFVGNVVRVAASGDQVYGSAAVVSGSGTLLIANSTISGNREEADPTDPGGAASGAVATFGRPLTLRGSTLSGNTATDVPGGFPDSGSIGGTGAADLVDTIVAGGTPTNCGSTAPTASHSIDTDGSCAIGTTNGNLTGVNPLLAPLAANGGPTLTHAIGAASPARDAADLTTCLATDQRGVVRPQGSACDIGAFELEPAVAGPPPPPAPSGPSPPAKDKTAPRIKIKLGHPTLRRALARGLSGQITTNEAALATIKVFVDGADARRVAGKSALLIRVAKGSHRFSKAGSRKVVARFTAKAKKALKVRPRVRFRVRIAVTDRAGNTKLVRRRLLLTSPN